MSEATDFYYDTATDVAVAGLLANIASGKITPSQRLLLMTLARSFDPNVQEKPTVIFPLMIASDEEGVVAYAMSGDYAERIADALTDDDR